MMTVERFYLGCSPESGSCRMLPDPIGAFVRHEAYEALLRKVEWLEQFRADVLACPIVEMTDCNNQVKPLPRHYEEVTWDHFPTIRVRIVPVEPATPSGGGKE